ncbi:TolC family protein [Fusobacterium sp. PH5-44]|uniref:TolC family protein n=1 Tax=unclassified Fusobacterium TaxID=2648384 RepID=UPI003D1ECCC6
MKKILFLALILTTMSYAKTVTLDSLLNQLSTTSYQNELYRIKKENNKVKEKYYKLDTWNGVQTSVTSGYSDKEDSWQTTAKASVGPFYIEGTKDYDDSDYATIGAEKSVKDLIYSKSKSQLKKLDMNKEVDRISYIQDLETQKLNLISLYKEYKSTELELKIKQSGINRLNTEVKKLQAAFKLGSIPEIELKTARTSLNNLNLESKVLNDNLSKIKERFLYDFNINLKKSSLADITPKKANLDELIKRYGQKELNKQQLEKNITEESVKYLKYDDKMPEIKVGLERSTKNDENRVVLSFSKKFFGTNLELEEEKASLDQKEIQLKQAKNENEGQKLKIYNTYYNYQKNYEVNKNKANLEKQKYDIKLLEYSSGNISYLDVMESFDNYLDYHVTSEKAKNDLYGYVYELIIRGEL